MIDVNTGALREAIRRFSRNTDWPYYLIFVGVTSAGRFAIGSRRLMHGDLLTWIRSDFEFFELDRLEFQNEDVFDGYVELEDDGTLAVRSMIGRPLPEGFESLILRSIAKVLLQEMQA